MLFDGIKQASAIAADSIERRGLISTVSPFRFMGNNHQLDIVTPLERGCCRSPRTRLRLKGRVVYWHPGADGKPGSWGTVKSAALTKFFVHRSALTNETRPLKVGTRVSFCPEPAREQGEMDRASDVIVIPHRKRKRLLKENL